MKKTITILALGLLMGACHSSEPSKEQETTTVNADTLASSKPDLSDKELNNIIESLPSPLEFSSLIQYSGAKYKESLLNGTDNRTRYNSQFTKAINLGIYGADLGYINIYNKTYSAIEYLNTVYALATDLNIGDFFDFNTLKRLAKNNKDLDSIVYITTRGFESMHKQLRKTNNSQISTLILAGGWIEGMYLTTGIIQSGESPNSKDLMFTVYDEHIVLDDIVTLLNAFKSQPNFDKIIIDFTNLKELYAGIASANTGKNTSITPEQFEKLAKEIKSIRAKLIE